MEILLRASSPVDSSKSLYKIYSVYYNDNLVQVQNIFCSCKLVAVAIIIGGGLYKLCEGSYDHVSTGFR